MGDYIIGACLFLLGTFLLFYVVRRLSESPGQIKPPAMSFAGLRRSATSGPSFYPRFAAMLALVLFSCLWCRSCVCRMTHSGPLTRRR